MCVCVSVLPPERGSQINELRHQSTAAGLFLIWGSLMLLSGWFTLVFFSILRVGRGAEFTAWIWGSAVSKSICVGEYQRVAPLPLSARVKKPSDVCHASQLTLLQTGTDWLFSVSQHLPGHGWHLSGPRGHARPQNRRPSGLDYSCLLPRVRRSKPEHHYQTRTCCK